MLLSAAVVCCIRWCISAKQASAAAPLAAMPCCPWLQAAAGGACAAAAAGAGAAGPVCRSAAGGRLGGRAAGRRFLGAPARLPVRQGGGQPQAGQTRAKAGSAAAGWCVCPGHALATAHPLCTGTLSNRRLLLMLWVALRHSLLHQLVLLCSAAGQLAPAWHSFLKLLGSLEELMPHLVKASQPPLSS